MNKDALTTALLLAAAPALTEEHIDSVIASKSFHQLTPVLTVCVLTLINGFQVTGQNACSTAKSYSRELGERFSYEDARNQIWPLEGYLFKQRQFENGEPEAAVVAPDATLTTSAAPDAGIESVGMLYGSDTFPSHLPSATGESITLGDVVRDAFGGTTLTYDEWNGLDAGARDQYIAAAATELTGYGWTFSDGQHRPIVPIQIEGTAEVVPDVEPAMWPTDVDAVVVTDGEGQSATVDATVEVVEVVEVVADGQPDAVAADQAAADADEPVNTEGTEEQAPPIADGHHWEKRDDGTETLRADDATANNANSAG